MAAPAPVIALPCRSEAAVAAPAVGDDAEPLEPNDPRLANGVIAGGKSN
jgi:hypothetical protein